MEGFFTSKWTISSSYRIIGSNKPRFLTNVYGPTTQRDKASFLHHLEWITNHIGNQCWILGGDFNMIHDLEEKRGGTRRLDSDNIHFQGIIDTLGLIDMETINGPFTWSNRRSGAQQVSCHLDKFLIFEPFMMEGLTWHATVIDAPGSNHWPILLRMDISGTPGKKPFHFKKFWLTHPDFQENIEQWWQEVVVPRGTPMYKFQQKLKNLKQRLKRWNKSTFGNIFQAQEF
jgi:hypothetical protein